MLRNMVGGPGCDPSPGTLGAGGPSSSSSSSSSSATPAYASLSSSSQVPGQGSLSGAMSSSSVQHGLGTAAGVVEAFHAAMERSGNASSVAGMGASAEAGAAAALMMANLGGQQAQPLRHGDPVERTIEGFLAAAAAGRVADLPATGAVFGAQEELRIRNRAKVLAGHLAPGIAPEEATAPLFRALGISPVESFLDGRYEQTVVGEGGEWARAFSAPFAAAGQLAPPQAALQGGGWEREFVTSQAQDWEAQWSGGRLAPGSSSSSSISGGGDQAVRSRLGEVLRSPAIEANPTLRESDFIKFLDKISAGASVEAAAAEAQAARALGQGSASAGSQDQQYLQGEAASGWAAEFAALEGGAYQGQERQQPEFGAQGLESRGAVLLPLTRACSSGRS